MIADKFVDLYARDSGLRDKLVAERDVVLTYTLRTLLDAGVMDHLAFGACEGVRGCKGPICQPPGD